MIDKLLWIPAFIVLLGTLVLFHEFGHFIVAKLFKIGVEEFAFGWGPKWFRLAKFGGTEYTVHPFPVGGFVKLKGEHPGEGGADETSSDSFLARPWYQRYLVYLAGPTMSFVLALLLFIVIGFSYGVPVATTSVGNVNKGSIAERAGLKVGDRVVDINGVAITSGQQLVDYVHGSIGKELSITLDRSGQRVVVKAVPEAGVLGPNVGLLGFAPGAIRENVGLLGSVKYGMEETYGWVTTTLKVIFSKEVGKNVGGPIAIVAATQASVKAGLEMFLFLMAMLSLSLGIINLMPIPIVDGGQMAILIAEGIKGRRLAPRTLEILSMIGVAIIALIFVTVMFLDISRLASGQMLK